MKRKNALAIALTLAIGVCSVNVMAAVITDNKVVVSEGQLVVRGTTSSAEGNVNCVITPKSAGKTDLNSVLYIKEGKSAQDGDFEFDFVY